MKHFLTIIRKSEFTDLFKYGYQHINANTVVEFDGNLKGLENNSEIKDKLFSNVNPFDYTFTIVVIHFQSSLETPNMVYIEDVQHIFPLDNDAKREIEISFDQRIRIEAPIWSEQVHELQEHMLFDGAKKGALNVWHTLKVEKDIRNYCTILSDNEIYELAHEAYTSLRPKGMKSFWIYLLRYERHGYYPKTPKGFFYDLVNVFINYKSKAEQLSESIETTGIYAFLESIPAKDTSEVLNSLNESEIGQNFLSEVNKCATIDADVVKTAILFLVFKNTFADGFNLNADSIKVLKHANKVFPEEFGYALFLIGIYLGHDHTFECLYEQLPLPIFKTPSPIRATISGHHKESGDEDGNKEAPFQDKSDDLNQEDVLSNNDTPTEADKGEVEEKSTDIEHKSEKQVNHTMESDDESSIGECDTTSNDVVQVTQNPTKETSKSAHANPTLFSEEELLDNTERIFPIKMRKKNKGGKAKTVKTEEEYLKLKQQGYYETDK